MARRRLSASLVSSLTYQPPGVTFVAAASANATSVTIPAHQVGDMILLFAFNSGTSLPAAPSASGTVPAWSSVVTSAASAGANRVSYFIATATTTTTGTWTNTAGMIAVVLRRASSIGGSSALAAQVSTMSAPAITLTKTNATSAVLHFFGVGTGSPSAIGSTPPGYTRRTSLLVTGNQFAIVLLTKNTSDCDGSVAQSITYSGFSGGCSSVEVLAA